MLSLFLARYQNDYDGVYSKVIAQRFYSQAILLCPEYGKDNETSIW